MWCWASIILMYGGSCSPHSIASIAALRGRSHVIIEVAATGVTTDCRGCLSYAAQSASQRLHRSSVSRIGDAAARGVASCEQSFFGKRSMDGGDRCEAAERTIHVQHIKGARSQTHNSQTGITLQCTAYCNKEHSHQNTCSLYTGGNLADTGSLELPPWNPPASWSLPWALHVPSDHYAAAKLSRF